MDLKDIGKALASIGLPLLGAALPIPGGMAIGTALANFISSPTAKPEDILATLTSNAEALEKAKEFQANNHSTLVKMAVDYELAQSKIDADALAMVNTTMQTEAAQSANENWWQTGWRPFNGYIVGLGSFVALCAACYLFYLGIVQKDTNAISTIPQLAMAVATILAVPGAAVGITAWHRGKAQIAEVMKDASSAAS